MTDRVKKVRISFVKRPIPRNGPTSSDNYNSSVDEVLLDLNALATAWNVELQPILNSLPRGVSDDRWTMSSAINPVVHGLDGTQVFVDMDATASSDDGRLWYEDLNYSRPKTIKEVTTDLYNDLVEFKTDTLDQLGLLSNGLSESQWTRLGVWVREGGSTTSAVDSVDGIAKINRGNIINTMTDIYENNAPAEDPIPYTIQSQLDYLAQLHGAAGWEVDPSTWNHNLSVSNLAQSAVSAGSYTLLNRGASVLTLEHDLNRIRWEIGTLRTGTGSDWNWNTPVNDPVGGSEVNLYTHVITNHGSGTQTLANPHGTDITEIDNYDAEPGYIRTFVGKTGTGSETPTYSSENYVTTGNSLETAIGSLDTALNTVSTNLTTHTSNTSNPHNVTRAQINAATRLEYNFSGHTDHTDPIVWSHNQGIAFPLIQVVSTAVGDYTGVLADEVYGVYEQEHGIIFADDFLSVEYIDSNTVHVYTSITQGVILGVF